MAFYDSESRKFVLNNFINSSWASLGHLRFLLSIDDTLDTDLHDDKYKKIQLILLRQKKGRARWEEWEERAKFTANQF